MIGIEGVIDRAVHNAHSTVHNVPQQENESETSLVHPTLSGPLFCSKMDVGD